jgi:hypothetical protein
MDGARDAVIAACDNTCGLIQAEGAKGFNGRGEIHGLGELNARAEQLSTAFAKCWFFSDRHHHK